MKNLDYILFSGKKNDIYLDCGLKIKQYSIEDINENGIGYNRYENIIWSLTRYSYEFKFDLEDMGIDYKEVNTYDIFAMISQSRDMKEVIEDLNFLFDDSFNIINGYLQSVRGIINKDTIEEIKEIFERIMFFKKPKERKPANEDAKKMIKMQIKKNSKKKVAYDLYSIMYSIVLSPHSNETYESMLKRTPHQIYASYLNINQQKDFDNTMSGIYSGVISSKDIDFNKINWINKLNNDEK